MSLYKGDKLVYGAGGSNISDSINTKQNTWSADKTNRHSDLRGATCTIGAHRGYHINHPQNTIASFRAAAEEGFAWCEIDIQRTADGFYMMTHDNSIKLYDNGVEKSIKVTESNYYDIKHMTWDAEGIYRINTLSEVFAQCKDLNMIFHLDVKNPTPEIKREVLDMAARLGWIHKIRMNLETDFKDYCDKYPTMEVIVPMTSDDISIYKNLSTYYGNNKRYCVANLSSSNGEDYVAKTISRSLAFGVPLIVCGVTGLNDKMWTPIAGGVYANLSLNFSMTDFKKMIDEAKYGEMVEISVNQTSLSTKIGDQTDVIQATSNGADNEGAGWLYAYSEDPEIIDAWNLGYGNSIKVRTTAHKTGNTNIVIFCTSGDMKKISVTVTE